MNWFKWFVCWYNERHVPAFFQDKNGKPTDKCVRCGYDLGEDK